VVFVVVAERRLLRLPDSWEVSAQKRKGFSNKQKSMMIMPWPDETQQGI